eukprot:scaffold26281_cov27-Phaeocystis_antarctica.AAC.1
MRDGRDALPPGGHFCHTQWSVRRSAQRWRIGCATRLGQRVNGPSPGEAGDEARVGRHADERLSVQRRGICSNHRGEIPRSNRPWPVSGCAPHRAGLHWPFEIRRSFPLVQVGGERP